MAGEQPPEQRFQRSPVYRMFAAELKDTVIELEKNGSDQYEKQYFLPPSGVPVSKVMIVGVAVEKEDVGDDQSFWRIRIADATGAITAYAGQYQPEAAQVMAGLEIPSFVAIVGKPSVYRPEGGPVVSIRPDSVVIVDEATRASFTIDAARQLIARATELKLHPDTVMAQMARSKYPNIGPNILLNMADQAIKSLLAPEPEKTPDTVPPVPAEQKAEQEVKQEEKPANKKETPPAAPPEKPKEKPKEKPPKSKEAKKAEPFGGGTEELADIVEEILKKDGPLNASGIAKGLKEKSIMTYVDTLEEALRLLKKEGRIIEPKTGVFKAA